MDAPTGASDPIGDAARALAAVAPLVPTADDLGALELVLKSGSERGHFTPGEDDRIRRAFHDYLTGRAVVREFIEDLRPIVFGRVATDASTRLRAFVVAYAGACLLVRAGRALVNRLAAHPVVRRKLDEASPERGVPRKQFSRVYRALTSPRNAWRLRWGRAHADQQRDAIEALANDPVVGPAIRIIRESESALAVGHREFLWGRLRFLRFLLGRKRRAMRGRAVFRVMEGGGRLVSTLRLPGYRKRVNPAVRSRLTEMLEPGDVLVTRHHDAVTNLFLPGYWPHASLHIGSEEQRRALGLEVSEELARRWSGPIRMLEARKDGVRLRALDDTLSVDAVVVIRPLLARDELRQALARALTHEGKLYDFAFDFFRADRLVCTEVVYRGFDGIGDIRFRLTPRGGHPTLSAEDLLDLALDRRGFEPVAIFGTRRSARRLVMGDGVREVLRESYRDLGVEAPAGPRPR